MIDQTTPPLVVALLKDALTTTITPPPPKAKNPNYRSGAWEGKTPEERSEYAKQLRARVHPENLKGTGRKAGIPNGWTKGTFAQAEAAAQAAADVALDAFADAGLLDDNLLARAALREVITILKLPLPDALKLRAARLLLRYTRRPPGVGRLDEKMGAATAWLDAFILADEADAKAVHPVVQNGHSHEGEGFSFVAAEAA